MILENGKKSEMTVVLQGLIFTCGEHKSVELLKVLHTNLICSPIKRLWREVLYGQTVIWLLISTFRCKNKS